MASGKTTLCMWSTRLIHMQRKWCTLKTSWLARIGTILMAALLAWTFVSELIDVRFQGHQCLRAVSCRAWTHRGKPVCARQRSLTLRLHTQCPNVWV